MRKYAAHWWWSRTGRKVSKANIVRVKYGIMEQRKNIAEMRRTGEMWWWGKISWGEKIKWRKTRQQGERGEKYPTWSQTETQAGVTASLRMYFTWTHKCPRTPKVHRSLSSLSILQSHENTSLHPHRSANIRSAHQPPHLGTEQLSMMDEAWINHEEGDRDINT